MCADALNAVLQGLPGMAGVSHCGQTRPYRQTTPATDTHDVS